MNQEKILKIIKGLSTFVLDDIIMMCDVEEIEAKNIVEKLILENKIILSDNEEYIYLSKSRLDKISLKIVEASPSKNIKVNLEITFREAAEYFLINHVKENCTPSSYKTYKSFIKAHLMQSFGKMKLIDITSNDIKDFIKLKQDEGVKNRRLRNCVMLLGNMFEKFKEWDFVEKSPYNGLINVKYSSQQKIQILNKFETDGLLNYAKEICPNLYLIILLALSTGLKKSEILALKKEDINFEERKISVNKTLYEGTFLIPKIKTVIRQVNIPESIICELMKIINNRIKSDYIFFDPKFSPLTMHRQLRKKFVVLLKELNLPIITFNDLRHTYAYNALQLGMSIDYLHKQLGDYSIQATMDRYRDFISA